MNLRSKDDWKKLLLCGAGAIALLIAGSCGNHDHSTLPDGYIDAPAQGSTVGRMAPVSGWAVSEDGIDSVRIYVDRKYRMNAKTGLPRPDIQKVYPSIADAANAAWQGDLSLEGVAPGPHTITANIRSKNGATATFSTRVTVQ